MEDETKLFYDLTAKESADRWYKEQILMPTIQEFVSLFPKNPKILDLGCGSGYDCMRLAKAGAKVIGIDYSHESIKIAKERCHSCQFEVMDFFELNGRFGKFDGIVAYAALIHIKPSDMPVFVERFVGVLKENGYFEAITQDGTGIKESQPIVKGKKLKRVIYLYDKEKLISCYSKYGLMFVKEGYIDNSLIKQGWRCYIFQKKTSG